MKTLTIIRGASGSGKTTLAKTLTDNYCEADQYFLDSNGDYKFNFRKLKHAHEYCKQKVLDQVKLESPCVVVSNTFTKLREMQWYVDLAGQYGYDIQVIHCQGNFQNVHGVPEDKVQQMKDNFEPYTCDFK